jgi:hypothetical protein
MFENQPRVKNRSPGKSFKMKLKPTRWHIATRHEPISTITTTCLTIIGRTARRVGAPDLLAYPRTQSQLAQAFA